MTHIPYEPPEREYADTIRWRIRKAQCKTCIETAEMGGYGADGTPVWVVYRDGGEFGCRPTFAEAVEYAHRKAEALG